MSLPLLLYLLLSLLLEMLAGICMLRRSSEAAVGEGLRLLRPLLALIAQQEEEQQPKEEAEVDTTSGKIPAPLNTAATADQASAHGSANGRPNRGAAGAKRSPQSVKGRDNGNDGGFKSSEGNTAAEVGERGEEEDDEDEEDVGEVEVVAEIQRLQSLDDPQLQLSHLEEQLQQLQACSTTGGEDRNGGGGEASGGAGDGASAASATRVAAVKASERDSESCDKRVTGNSDTGGGGGGDSGGDIGVGDGGDGGSFVFDNAVEERKLMELEAEFVPLPWERNSTAPTIVFDREVLLSVRGYISARFNLLSLNSPKKCFACLRNVATHDWTFSKRYFDGCVRALQVQAYERLRKADRYRRHRKPTPQVREWLGGGGHRTGLTGTF